MARIDHVNITVSNLEESIRWYRDLFGFEKVESGLSQLGKPWAIVAYNDSMIVMSEHPQKKSADKNKDETIHRVFHFGLRITDETAWRSKVKVHGLKINYGGVIHYPHSQSWYVRDPSGHEIEVSCTGGGPLKFPEAAGVG